jgi:hypothetical protein
MREYTGNRVFQALRAGYASQAQAINLPTEPLMVEYLEGAKPLETLPASYWNWFISSISNNDPRVADALNDIYGAIDYIFIQVEQSYTNSPSDLFHALRTAWLRDVDNISGAIDAFGYRIATVEGKIITLEDRATAAEGKITTLEGKVIIVSKTAAGLCPQLPNETTTTKYLRQDGTWQVPPNTTYAEMSGTTLGLVRLNGNYTFTGTINVPTPALPS